MSEATPLLPIGAALGEGPIWFDDALWFVDITSQHIYRHDPVAGTTDRWDAPEPVGWVLPTTGAHLIAGLQSGPHRFLPDRGTFERIAHVENHLQGNRLNDAAASPQGRIYFGTMDSGEAAASGRVYVLESGTVRMTSIAATPITNGPAIAPAGDRLYHVDTPARTITIHAVAADGSVGPARPFLTFTGDEGHPDGAICDAEGGIWVGFYGGWAARRFSPEGVLTQEVRFPVANVTKVALGGPDGCTGFATTARQGLDEAAIAAQPLAGAVFTFRAAIPAAPVNRADS